MNNSPAKFDWMRADASLLISVLILVILGAASVFSSSSYLADQRYDNSAYYFLRHVLRIIVGLVLLYMVAARDYRYWLTKSELFLLVTVILLGMLLLNLPFITPRNGATSWFRLGPFSFQPSDFAKYALIMLLAIKLHDKREELDTFQGYLRVFALVLVVVVPVALQHDLGTAALITIIAFLMFFFAEVHLAYLGATILTVTTGALTYILINPYQLKRLLDFMRSFIGDGPLPYQLKQSLIALAQGGVLGQGIGESRQKYLFLPEAHNDFIFAMIGEEYGLLGTAGVLILFLVIIRRGILIAQQAPDAYGRYLAAGITASIASYGLINAGVALGVLPTTGIPMPFLSYGGSAIVAHLGAVGLLLNISAQSSPAYAQGPGWRAYKERLETRIFKFPLPALSARPRTRRATAIRARVR